MIENDCIKHISKGGGGDIITSQIYDNFALEVDFLISEGANSGIKYLVDPGLIERDGTARFRGRDRFPL